MGQKTNPIGNRLGFIRGWDSNWYGGNDYDLKPEWRKWASEVGGYPKINGKNVEFGHFMRDIDVG